MTKYLINSVSRSFWSIIKTREVENPGSTRKLPNSEHPTYQVSETTLDKSKGCK